MAGQLARPNCRSAQESWSPWALYGLSLVAAIFYGVSQAVIALILRS
jgi:hypothetical protein